MSSIRDQIVSYVVDLLGGPDKPENVKVRRYSLDKIDFQKDPAQKVIEVHPGKDVPDPLRKGQALVKRTMLLQLDAYAAGDPIDAALDPMLCWITSKLGSNEAIGGLSLDVREGPSEWDEEAAQMGIGLCKVTFEIDYIHNRNNQETKP